MRAKKVDNTHAGIVNALRASGASVFSTAALGCGFPDLVASYRNWTCLIECKTGRGGLNALQRQFQDNWGGLILVCRTPEEAVSEFWKAWSAGLIHRAPALGTVRKVKGRMGEE